MMYEVELSFTVVVRRKITVEADDLLRLAEKVNEVRLYAEPRGSNENFDPKLQVDDGDVGAVVPVAESVTLSVPF